MLYLRHFTDQHGPTETGRIPLADQAAIHLERALLVADAEACHCELQAAFGYDSNLARWAIQAAAYNTRHTVRSFDEAADVLGERLAQILSTSLTAEDLQPNEAIHDIENRLPALVAKLAAYEQRVAAYDAQLEREKLESLKELAYGASHEINNPLANIAARAQTLLQDEADPDRQRKLSAIHRQAMRAHEMIADLMLFARPPKLTLAPCDLGQIATRVVSDLSLLARERNIELTCETGGDHIELSADETQIAVAIHAVVVNAIDAVGAGGHVEVCVRALERGGQPWADVLVRDDGPGISDQVRRHMFDPFFSGREAGRGLGFGLSKVWRIITDHGGEVVVQRAPCRGAEIAILIPKDQRAVGCRP